MSVCWRIVEGGLVVEFGEAPNVGDAVFAARNVERDEEPTKADLIFGRPERRLHVVDADTGQALASLTVE